MTIPAPIPTAPLTGASLTTDARLARNSEILIRRSGSEVVALDTAHGVFYSFNATADFVFGALDGHATLEEVATRLTDEFEVDGDTARDAVLTLCAQLVDRNFAHVIGAG